MREHSLCYVERVICVNFSVWAMKGWYRGPTYEELHTSLCRANQHYTSPYCSGSRCSHTCTEKMDLIGQNFGGQNCRKSVLLPKILSTPNIFSAEIFCLLKSKTRQINTNLMFLVNCMGKWRNRWKNFVGQSCRNFRNFVHWKFCPPKFCPIRYVCLVPVTWSDFRHILATLIPYLGTTRI